jgi:hypothetical protein
MKLLMFLVNQLCILGFPIFYYFHEAYCQPYEFSFFAFCEWTLVLLNIFFHVLNYPTNSLAILTEYRTAKQK